MSKGNVATSPAQVQYEQDAQQTANKALSLWLPVQQYYNQQLQQNQPALEQMARGRAAATARTQGFDATLRGLSADSDRGASAGSGRYLMALGRGLDTSGAGAVSGATAAQAAAHMNYVQGLQNVIGMNLSSQAKAMGGLGAAAAQEQAYEQQKATFRNNAIAGIESFLADPAGQGGGGGGGGGMGGMTSLINSMGSHGGGGVGGSTMAMPSGYGEA